MSWPLELTGVLVTGDQITGGVRLVAERKSQSLAQSGQESVIELELALTLKDGSGRKTPKAEV
jgi:hypothetical protein